MFSFTRPPPSPCSLLELQALVALSEQAAPKLREAMVQAALREKDAEVRRWLGCQRRVVSWPIVLSHPVTLIASPLYYQQQLVSLHSG